MFGEGIPLRSLPSLKVEREFPPFPLKDLRPLLKSLKRNLLFILHIIHPWFKKRNPNTNRRYLSELLFIIDTSKCDTGIVTVAGFGQLPGRSVRQTNSSVRG